MLLEHSFSLFLALLVSHLLGDFVFQGDRLARRKKASVLRAYLRHGTVHYVLSYTLVGIFVPETLLSAGLHVLLPILAASHVLADYSKEHWLSQLSMRPLLVFLIDQVVHVGLLLLLLVAFAGDSPEELRLAWSWMLERRDQALWVLIIYLGTIFGGGYLTKVMLSAALDEEREADGGEHSSDLRGGMFIGWAERFIVVTAVIAGSLEAVGLILTAKSIAAAFRFDKENKRIGDYFLLGTLISLSIALIGGLLLLRLLRGTFIPG